jgi:hypothetical protein
MDDSPDKTRWAHETEPGQRRFVVAADQLEIAIAVWLRVMPARLWRPYLKMLEIDPKRRTEEDRVDPRDILAAYLRGQFERAHWEASYPESAQPFNRPNWRR